MRAQRRGRRRETAGIARCRPDEQHPTLINCTWLDVTRHRDAARSLGYGEKRVNPLAVRREGLLEKAKGLVVVRFGQRGVVRTEMSHE